MREKILVTGGGGLLGYAVREACPEAVFITRKDCDLTDAVQTRRLFRKIQPRHVLHLAAEVGGVKRNLAHNADLFAANAQINLNTLNAAHEVGVDRLISVLSSCAYKYYDDRPSNEDDLHKDLPFDGNLGYGFSKRMLDIQTRLFNDQYGCHFSTITPVTMYGSNDNWDLEDGHVLGSLIHKCWIVKQKGDSLPVWGSGKAVRQFVYSKDVARILLELLNETDASPSMIVAPDAGITIHDLAHAVAGAMDFSGAIIFDTSKPEGQLIRRLESRNFPGHFPKFSFTPLDQGLRETALWFARQSRKASESIVSL